jgi:type I restriction-modification system DNA methylase subunit|tara:strand:- start:285 stop:617 length:333 start_codon:yes stop_codon:yes gene_type:complete
MTEDHKKTLESKLWNIANTLRGKMGADEFRDYILGFIFYKYLSERMHLFADEILKHDGIKFDAIDETTAPPSFAYKGGRFNPATYTRHHSSTFLSIPIKLMTEHGRTCRF